MRVLCSWHLLQIAIMKIPFFAFGFGKVATSSALKIFLVLAYLSYLRVFRGKPISCCEKGQLLLCSGLEGLVGGNSLAMVSGWTQENSQYFLSKLF